MNRSCKKSRLTTYPIPFILTADMIRVLFIDDDINLQKIFRMILSGDFNVISAYTGQEGVRRVQEHKPDVVAVVINGTFRNMGPAEAARLVQQLDPKVAIPCHYDLFRANLVSPQAFHTNLQMLGIGEKYRRLEHGAPFAFPVPPS